MRKVCTYALLIFVVCLAKVVCGEGFVAGTLVSASHGSIPIQELIVGDQVQACTFNDNTVSAPVANVISHDVDMFIRLEVDDDTIDLTHDQLLFVPLQRTWLPASDVRPGMYLLGTSLRAVRVHSVAKIEQKTLVHTISLKDHHNFLVGKPGIVAHNFSECAVLAGQAAEGATFLSAFLAANPLVAPITIGVGGAGLVGYLIWNAVSEIKESRKAKRDKGKNGGGGGHKPEEPKKPRNDERYNNMYEVFRNALIGKLLQDAAEPTRFYCQGAKIFKAIKDVVEYGIKQGDWFYLDKLHGDHIEVFKSCGKIMRTVLNMDGTQNLKKLTNALAEGRKITQWIN